MNEKIQHIISEIASKKEVLMEKIHELSSELDRSKAFQAELTAKVVEMSNKSALLELENVELKSELEKAKNENVQIVEEIATVKTLSIGEIEALVGEIDYCLNQLKNN